MARTRGKKILIGCGIGCLGLLVLGVGGCISFTVWLNRPGELLEPERLVDRGTSGFVELTLRSEDPGTARMFVRLLEASQRVNRRALDHLGPGLSNWILQMQQRRSERQLRELLPTSFSWTMHPGGPEADQDLHLFALSIERLGNRMVLLDWILGRVLRRGREAASESYGDERIYTFQTDEGLEPAVFIRDRDIYFATSVTEARRAVDMLRGEEGVSSARGEDVGPWLANLPDAALRGALTNVNGEILRTWIALAGDEAAVAAPDSEPWASMRAVTISGGFVESGRFEGVADFWGPDAAWAEAHAGSFAETLVRDYSRGHFPFELEVSVEGERIRVRFAADDLALWLESL